MGNHSIDCDFCGVDLRSYSHAPGCPGPAYDVALAEWRRQKQEHVGKATEHLKIALLEAEQREAQRFMEINPPPPKPKMR